MSNTSAGRSKWPYVPLTTVAEKIQDGTHFSPLSTSGPFRYVTSRNIRPGYLDLESCGWISEREHKAIFRRCDPRYGDILLTKDGANTGNASINTLHEEISLLSSVAMIRTDPTVADGHFVLQYLLSPEGQTRLTDLVSGNAITRLTLAKIKAFSIPSAPLPEQRAIAAVLDSLDDAIQKTEQIIAKLQQVKQGLLHDLLTRGIDDNGELRDPERHPEQFQDSPLGRIPKGWRIVQLQALLEHVIDYRGRTPLKLGMRWGSGEIPALSAMNVQMGRIDLSRETYFGSDALYRRWMTDGDVKRGDIIITLEAPLGNVAQVSDERRYILSQRVVLLRFRRMDISNDFAAWQMRSDPIQRQLVRWSTGTTATGIQRAKLNLIPLLVPSLTEQSSVTILLHCHEAHITAQSLELEKLRELKVGLSDDLLTGRVRTTSLPGFSA